VNSNDSPDSDIEAYRRASEALLRLIRSERHASRTRASRRRRAEIKLKRIRWMLNSIGDPQRAYPTVHITGTSGKGSTAATVAAILTAAGYRVGLHTSPYLQVATEKLQIGPSLIDADSFAETVTRVLGYAARVCPPEQSDLPISYAEVWSVLGYLWFAEREVDIAVVEVGAGGRFDATNVIEPVVSVITSVGLDHLVTLGPSISDIAWHKAGIIKPGGTAVVGDVPAEAFEVIASEASAVSADVIAAGDFDLSRTRFPCTEEYFQKRNAQLAAVVVLVLNRRGFTIPKAAIGVGIDSARLPGRLEQMPGTIDPPVWVDGAHNADKIAAITREVVRLRSGSSLPVIVLGMLSSKDPPSIMAQFKTAASSMVLTEPFVRGKKSLSADRLAHAVADSGFAGAIHVEPDPDAAVRLAEGLAKKERAAVLVTGSMYLAGQIRRRWFPDQEIVRQRTPWPTLTRNTG
jgi:dihydrofolate synthase / folylpolyglutamate synthase